MPGFSGKKIPEKFILGRKSRENSRDLDLGQDRPTQRVLAKFVDPNATPPPLEFGLFSRAYSPFRASVHSLWEKIKKP